VTIKLARPAQPRLWRNLAIVSTTVTLAAMPGHAQSGALALDQAAQMGARLWMADGTEGGETAAPAEPAPATEGGEQGEGGVEATGDETVDFLAGLLQIEGHLTSGLALIAAGDTANGQAHLGHPRAEVYDGLKHHLTELGQPQFEDALDRLLDAATDGADAPTLTALQAEVMTAIAAARDAAVTGDPRDDFSAIVFLIRKAGAEWSEGVKNGEIAELHEYQDAWGFVQAARARATDLSASTDAAIKSAAMATLTALDEVAPALPSVTPTGLIGGEAEMFAGAAARIELAAYKVK
jgi:hypothetical protein